MSRILIPRAALGGPAAIAASIGPGLPAIAAPEHTIHCACITWDKTASMPGHAGEPPAARSTFAAGGGFIYVPRRRERPLLET